MTRTAARIELGGEIDLSASRDLTRLLASLDSLQLVVEADLQEVTFLDTAGVEPLVEATRRRAESHAPPLRIAECSPAAQRLLGYAGIGGDPLLDVRAWDRLPLAAQRLS